MGKKRKTREEKIRARFRRQAASGGETNPTFNFVKREFSEEKTSNQELASKLERPERTNQTLVLASTSRDLLKTFILASLIFTTELVLYFALKS